jgi:hypothetical protein
MLNLHYAGFQFGILQGELCVLYDMLIFGILVFWWANPWMND